MRTLLFSLLLLGFCFSNTYAQHSAPKRGTVPLSGNVILRDAEDKYNARVYSLEMPDPDENKQSGELKKVKERIAELFPRQVQAKFKAQSKKTSAPMPTVDVSYVADSMPGIPPDNYVAINRDSQAVSVMNTFISVHNARTGQITLRKGLKNFSSSVGLNNVLNDNRFDPKIIYDPEADRFISVMLNGINQYNWIVVGFSATSDPSGLWHFYKFYGDYQNDTTFFDYPAIAMTKDEFFITGNKVIDNVSWQTGFKKTVVYQIRKSDGYNGDTALTYQLWDSIVYNGNYIRNLYPVKGGASIKGPAQYFVGDRILDVQNDTFFLVKLPDTIGSANNNITVTALVSNLNYGVPPDGRQPDTSVTLMTNDARILGGYVEGNEIQFVNATVNPAIGGSAIYHGVISNYDTNPAVQGELFAIDTLDFGYPNISYAGNQGGHNQSIISFDFTGPNRYPGFGAIFYDGNQLSDMLTVKNGTGSISQLSGREQRWGDYSGSQVDWGAMESVWVVGIYGRADKKYGNYMARLFSPYYTGVPQISANTNVNAQSVLYPNPAWQFINFDFDVAEDNVLNFIVYNMNGQRVDQILNSRCEKGKNRLQFNIAPLITGTYILKVTDQKGKMVYTHTFVKN